VQRVLSNDLWSEVRKQARASNTRIGAIAYVTRDLVGFRKGDVLVVDASARAIQNGETDAGLLRKLHNKGVHLYDCADLHAKILLLDDVAIIGSGNMSSSSENRMVEAALISDHGSVVAGVASLIEQLVKQSSELDRKQIAQLCTITVIRRGGWNAARPNRRKTRITNLGNRTWIVGVRELKHDPSPEEQTLIDSATRSLHERLGAFAPIER
jgi:phosphatidylserine/phosphatidylglycerophosphate/cardiolipin synthase-like enzyme